MGVAYWVLSACTADLCQGERSAEGNGGGNVENPTNPPERTATLSLARVGRADEREWCVLQGLMPNASLEYGMCAGSGP
uniref:Putative secreted protein n=1 Tax=Anopheles darlingi TaxID=43151 RepID=A0A2M4DBZ9_ANODA